MKWNKEVQWNKNVLRLLAVGAIILQVANHINPETNRVANALYDLGCMTMFVIVSVGLAIIAAIEDALQKITFVNAYNKIVEDEKEE